MSVAATLRQIRSHLRRKLLRYPIGRVDGTELTLIGFTTGKSRNQAYGLFHCDCGSAKILQPRYVFGHSRGTTQTTNCGGSKHPHKRWIGSVGYPAWHAWISANYGKARYLSCSFCGHRSELNQWAYLHGAPNELRSIEGKYRGLAYVTDARWYSVLCRPCHGSYDRAWANGTPPLARWLHALFGGAGLH